MVDKCKPLKQENSTDGTQDDMGYSTEMNPDEDYVSCKGVSFENSDGHLIDRAADGQIQFRDPVNGLYKLDKVIGYKGHAQRTNGLVNNTTTLETFLQWSDILPYDDYYKISWFYQWSLNIASNDFVAELNFDSGDIIIDHRQEPKDSSGTGITLPNTTGGSTNTGTDQRYFATGFIIENLSAGSHTFNIDYKCNSNNHRAAIYRASITVERFA